MHVLGPVFFIKDLNTLHYLLGIEVNCFIDGFSLTTEKMPQNFFSQASTAQCKPIVPLIATKQQALKHGDKYYVDSSHFRSIAGFLQHIALWMTPCGRMHAHGKMHSPICLRYALVSAFCRVLLFIYLT